MFSSLYISLCLICWLMSVVNSSYDTSMVNRLMENREEFIQDGLSYFNGTTLQSVREGKSLHEVRCIISVENWTKWMLGFPVVYTDYGGFQSGLHEREVFSAHRELVVAVNELESMTGTAGAIAWALGGPERRQHLILMWSIPYNQAFFNSYYGVGVVKTSGSRLTRDLLPFWYNRMYEGSSSAFQRASAKQKVVFKADDVFVLAHMDNDPYEPLVNVSVVPWATRNLAPSVWHQLYLSTVRDVEHHALSSAAHVTPHIIIVFIFINVL